MTMNVTVASRIYSPEAAAASFRLAAAAEALTGDGHQVNVLTVSTPKGENAPASRRNPRVHRFPVVRDRSGYVRGYIPYVSFDLPLFFRLLCSPKSDVTLVEPPPTTGAVVRVVSWLRRTPYVWYAADVWSDATQIAGAPKAVVAVVRALERFAVRGAAGTVAVSGGVAERVQELGGRNVEVIPNGIDTATYRLDAEPLDPEERSQLGVTGPYIVYAGTASEWQGATVFAEAMREVAKSSEEAQIVFVGQGSEWEDLERISAELREEHGRDVLVLIPPRSPAFVASLLVGAQAGAVSIVPGQGYDFAYPTKALAALAAGVPVVYAGAGPLAEEIDTNALGWTADHDPARVGQALLEAFEADDKHRAGPSLRNHVLRNRSLTTTGKRVARFLRSVGKPGT